MERDFVLSVVELTNLVPLDTVDLNSVHQQGSTWRFGILNSLDNYSLGSGERYDALLMIRGPNQEIRLFDSDRGLSMNRIRRLYERHGICES